MKHIDIGIMAFSNINDIERNSPKNIFVYNCGYYIIHKKATDLTEINNTAGYLLVYLHKGTMQVLTDGDYRQLKEGNVLIFHPNELRRIIYDANEENARYFVYFQGPDVERFLKQLSLFDRLIYKTGSIPSVIDNFKAIIDDYKANDFDHDVNRLCNLFAILKTVSEASQGDSSAKKTKTTSEIDGVIEIMKSSYYKNYDLKYYADKCNVSVPTFIRHFKSQTGVSPIKFLNDIKIDVAKSFLSNTNLSVSEISFNVGMQNPLYFCNFFKKNTGLNPSAYRERNSISDS